MINWRQISPAELSASSTSSQKSDVQWILVFILAILVSNVVFLFYIAPHVELKPGQAEIFFNMAAYTAPIQILLLLALRFKFLSLQTIKWVQYLAIYIAGSYGYINGGGAIGPFAGFYVAFLCLTIAFLSTRVAVFFGGLSFVPITLTLFLEDLGIGNPYLVEGETLSEHVIVAILFLFAAVLSVALATNSIAAGLEKNVLLTMRLRTKNLELEKEKSEVETRIKLRTWQLADANKSLKEQTEELLHAKNKAEEADRTKSNFLANMSHEIRTPLTSIIGTADILMEDVIGENAELVEMIYKGGHRLMDTLNSVLDLAQLEGQSMKLNRQATNLVEEVEAVSELFSNRALSKGLGLEVIIEGQGPFYSDLDKAAFDRVLQNLIGNSMKFTEQGKITVLVKGEADHLKVVVTDTGIGIGEEYLPKIFDQFSQESSGESRAFEGNGLGLALCKGLVEMMDGIIQVESELGVGTSFTVEFPKSKQIPEELPRA